jgi:DNA-binding GntR family transcriptional regulator
MSTLVDKIAQAMRVDIFHGNLRPGQPLKQVELANRYGVSPIPLREALQRLQVEGLVEYFAYRGAIVARMRKSEAADIIDIRNALELLAYELALPLLDDDQFAELATLTEALESPKAYEQPDFFMEKILAYFEVLLSRCNRPLLLDMIQTNLKRATRYYAELLRHSPKGLPDGPGSHDFLAPIKARDMDRLRVLVEQRHAAYLAALAQYLED